MKNNIFKIFLSVIFCLVCTISYAVEQFNFDVTEVRILDNGNKFIGTKRGKITSNNGIIIDANQFEYNKKTNILQAEGNVEIFDNINNSKIFTEKIIYKKNESKIITKNGSKAIDLTNNIEILAEEFEYNIKLNNIVAKKNVFIEDKIEDYNIKSNFIKYFRNDGKIITQGKTFAKIKSKYTFESENLTFLKNSMELISDAKTIITDKKNVYNLSKFKYFLSKEELIGEKIIVFSNYKLPKSDKFYFSSGIINLGNQNFIAKDTEIDIHKGIFNNTDNDPRLKGVSSIKEGPITKINKGIFTSCKKDDNCPPWSIQASEIRHDKKKKEINYKNAILKIYDVPVLYFPKFFHPDPTVNRKSGILKPVLNNSSLLGNSLSVPYYHVFSNKSDLTSAPTFFDSGIKMIQNEFRKIGNNFDLLLNFGHSRDYKSTTQSKNKNTSYLFSKLNLDLGLEKFNSSKMYINLEKVTNDTFLKIFDGNLIENTNSLKPKDNNVLYSELKLSLNHDNYNLTTGLQSYENLQLNNNDRYQYILPYYDFNKILSSNLMNGSLNFNSNGSNDLNDTNKLKSRISNSLSYSSLDFFSKYGFKNNFNINLKNLNSIGKNISEFKSSPQVEFSSLFELKSIIPMKKENDRYINFLTPKISFRMNPGDMKDNNTNERTINTDNIFSLDRLGLVDSFEAGRSLTVGLDYKKQMLKDMNKYFEFKLASVLRDQEENFIPKSTTLNKKSSNIFGSLTGSFSKNLNLNYNFAIDNNLNELDHNDINAELTLGNFVTSLNFIKEQDEMGDQSFIKNSTYYKINEKNKISFNTRRNRKINLTEFYNLVYEYKNDCLVAGIKYKKTYYEDRDLKPVEDLLFTITLFPLTTFEQKVDQ